MAVLNNRLAKRKGKRAYQGRVIGGVLAYFLLNHAEDIQAEFYQSQRDALSARLPGLFSASELASIEAAVGTDAPQPLLGDLPPRAQER